MTPLPWIPPAPTNAPTPAPLREISTVTVHHGATRTCVIHRDRLVAATVGVLLPFVPGALFVFGFWWGFGGLIVALVGLLAFTGDRITIRRTASGPSVVVWRLLAGVPYGRVALTGDVVLRHEDMWFDLYGEGDVWSLSDSAGRTVEFEPLWGVSEVFGAELGAALTRHQHARPGAQAASP